MADNSEKTGLGLVGAIQTVFIVNKLTDAGDIAGWSWWWVLSPLWISLGVAILLAILAAIIAAVTK